MVIIRATAALLQKLGVEPDPQPGTSTTALGTWFATTLQVRRGRYVLAISGETMLPVVLLGRDLGTLGARLATGAAEVLAAVRPLDHRSRRRDVSGEPDPCAALAACRA